VRRIANPLAASIAGAALVTIAATIYLMHGMAAGPGADLGSFSWFVLTWVVMMAAMMLPSVAPMAMTFALVTAQRSAKGQAAFVPTWIFIAGYFAAWTAYGIAAYGIDHLIRWWNPAFLAWNHGGPWIAGASVALAGLYQLTPIKRRCLAHCRSPLHFFLEDWREGPLGAWQMGLHHGFFCVACCWGLMLLLFAVGVMSLFWMSAIAVLIFAEKVFGAGPRLATVFGVAILALGVWIAVAPGTVPGLTPPACLMEMPGMPGMKMPCA